MQSKATGKSNDTAGARSQLSELDLASLGSTKQVASQEELAAAMLNPGVSIIQLSRESPLRHLTPAQHVAGLLRSHSWHSVARV